MEPDRWLGIELRHLIALEAVSREGSFGRAATSLGYTQSAVSQQIAMLERIVGERLVERPGGPKPVSLTEAGRLLLGHAQAIVARLSAAQADLAALSEGAAGVLRVGIYQSIGARVLPELMRRFGESWPLVEIQLTELADDGELLRLVEHGELDLTFADMPLVEGPFDGVELLRDPYVLLLPPSSPLAKRSAPPTTHEIASLDLIGYRSCRSLDQIQGSFREPLHFVFRSDQNGTLQGLVAAGVGGAIMPRLAIEPHEDGVVEHDLTGRVPPRVISIIWHRDRYRSPAAKAFVETAREVCAELQKESLAA
jgi:DNA-binding transcriptional LysR family regulator